MSLSTLESIFEVLFFFERVFFVVVALFIELLLFGILFFWFFFEISSVFNLVLPLLNGGITGLDAFPGVFSPITFSSWDPVRLLSHRQTG